MKLLLALDESLHSQHASQLITHFADPPMLHVLNVVDIGALEHAYLAPGLPEAYFETYRQEVSRLAQRVLHEARDKLSPYCREVRLIADSGDPADSIIQTAEETGAELIIIGHQGVTAKSTFLLGGVSQKVATYAPCSVLVVKRATPVLDRVLLALDGSDASDKAARFLEGGPFKPPIQVSAVRVWASMELGGQTGSTPEVDSSAGVSAVQARDEDFLRGVAERFKGGPYQVETEWLRGDPPFAILESAGRHDVQIVAMGARGLKGIKRFLLGSVSQKVLSHAQCSVLIVR